MLLFAVTVVADGGSGGEGGSVLLLLGLLNNIHLISFLAGYRRQKGVINKQNPEKPTKL